MNSEGLYAPGDQPEKERGREREREREREKEKEKKREKERKTRGPELSWSKGVLINMVWAYILSYKVVILSKDKD